ncbi:hypothetical protein FEM48_Zijuj11G0008700 [Ziziphus jujuba var. spinosa]|uniref:Uncharacterized protein n=1 Tax=Ziziphus jujuba var. spinosa TaxID=714518 RepID=A0A978UFW7_ZIZJJ|nr:hypothetical protein FEM48_Zijuj11G0008700 [Ziziphus jujuba var. spinosa]
MVSMIKVYAVILLLIFVSMSSGRVQGIRNGFYHRNTPNEVTVEKEMRNLMSVEEVLDYPPARPNPRHGKGQP